MLIKNLKSEFCTDQYTDTEMFSILLADPVVEGVKKRRELLDANRWLADDTTIEYTPNSGTSVEDSEIYAETITVRIGLDAMLFIVTDDNGDMYETESVPYKALDKERFLLAYGDDNEVYEYDYEEGDDLDDYDAFYADSLEEAEEMLRAKVDEIRLNDPNYYGVKVADDRD